MDDMVKAALIEFIKLTFQAGFSAIERANLSEEEKDDLYNSVKERFKENTAEELPDV